MFAEITFFHFLSHKAQKARLKYQNYQKNSIIYFIKLILNRIIYVS